MTPAPVADAEEIENKPLPKVVVEDVKDDEKDEDDEDDDKDDGAPGSNGGCKQSRSEKKSRKAMLKLGMEPVTGVSRQGHHQEDQEHSVRHFQARCFQEPSL
ncbi:hypothetical protein MLD38_015722 [Melastoma candidum]|uniref:Uncharacterized protein n=1 Tax=Melastoma candidum TaxID=119954 RepID=A0ACB9RH67_9MYRT|nr:hypothetical protein MLD38_015722 [Melastoma candidum]